MSLVDELAKVGFRVFEATSADEALTILKANSGVEAIITDVDLPGLMDGLNLARLVQQMNPDVATLQISGYPKTSKNDLPGRVAIVSEPYEIDLVVNQIGELAVR